jgi:putative FmdB family regulatory protein
MGVERPPLLTMPLYEYYCDECGVVDTVIRPMSECSYGRGCFNCAGAMRRIYSPPTLVNRSKPKGFRFDKTNFNANDQKLAALQLAESKGPRDMREAMKNFGNTAKQVLAYKKEKYV